jgi:hypothetical protein
MPDGIVAARPWIARGVNATLSGMFDVSLEQAAIQTLRIPVLALYRSFKSHSAASQLRKPNIL